MKLYRYELFCEDEPQNVGFIVGLDDLGLSCEQVEYLTAPFDNELAIPNIPIRNAVCFFTEYGKKKFQDAINTVVSAYTDSIFEVKELRVDLLDKYDSQIIYQDENQVCLPVSLLKQII